jgi:hypothetical protein
MSTPLAKVKQRFESKDKLVEAVQQFLNDELWLPRLSSDRGGSKALKHVSNAKLLKLHETFSRVKEQFGTRAKLVDAILELGKRVKDAGYRTRIEAHPVPRLFDLYQSLKRGSGAKPEKAKATPAKKPAKAAKAASPAKPRARKPKATA